MIEPSIRGLSSWLPARWQWQYGICGIQGCIPVHARLCSERAGAEVSRCFILCCECRLLLDCCSLGSCRQRRQRAGGKPCATAALYSRTAGVCTRPTRHPVHHPLGLAKCLAPPKPLKPLDHSLTPLWLCCVALPCPLQARKTANSWKAVDQQLTHAGTVRVTGGFPEHVGTCSQRPRTLCCGRPGLLSQQSCNDEYQFPAGTPQCCSVLFVRNTNSSSFVGVA